MEKKLLQIDIIGDLFLHQQRFPNPFLTSTGVPPVDTVPVAKGRKQVTPKVTQSVQSTAQFQSTMGCPGRSGQGHPSGQAEDL